MQGRSFVLTLILGVLVMFSAAYSMAQKTNQLNVLDAYPVSEVTESKKSVVSLYEVSSSDYYPSEDRSKRGARSQSRSGVSRPGFDLPTGFYFIAVPAFVIVLLSVIVFFLNEFDAQRREEKQQAELQIFDSE